jgi:hypothetical protein
MKLRGKELQQRVKKVPGVRGGPVGLPSFKRHCRHLQVSQTRLQAKNFVLRKKVKELDDQLDKLTL